MGFVYYGNYPQYYEVGRVETMREMGVSYKALEDSGVLLPVADMKINYLKPAHYDDLLKVKTTVPKLPEVKFVFHYEVYKEGELINKGDTTLVFVDETTLRPCRIPDYLREKLKSYLA